MRASDFNLEEKLQLVKGMGSWHINDVNGKVISIHLSDGPHGLRAQAENAKSNNDSITACCFPTASASANSFNPELLEQMGDAIAKEALQAGVSVVLGPGVNIKRSPVCGRNFEYFSEDPYLAAEMAIGFVSGVEKNNVATSLKHFAANSQETHRMTSNSMVDERALREIYLRAFEKVIKKAKPATVMASYNLLNGKPACENKWLLTDILRNEWGYEGLVMSDWGACVNPGLCIEAGMDLEMPDSHGNHKEDILKALKEGRLSEKSLDRAVDRVLELVEKYKPMHSDGLHNIQSELLAEHALLAERISEESAVLLKNESVLPLNNPTKVILIGDLAENMRIQGGGSSHIKTGRLTTIAEAFKKAGVESVFFKGYDSNSNAKSDISAEDERLKKEAIDGLRRELSLDSTTPVLVFGGLTDRAEGEGYDRESFSLPINQIKFYEEIRKITENIIFVSFGGSPYDISCISYAKAILGMYLGGEGVANACVNILTGKVNPSGRLAETWPQRLEDTPCFGRYGRDNSTVDDVPYSESIFIGYRYYDTFNVKTNYKFGYGLSYTSFSYSNMNIIREGEKVRINVDVTNTGSVEGKETILAFVKNPAGDIIRANRELRAFSKISLMPKESKTVEVILDDRAFEVFDASAGKYITVAGQYEIELSKAVGDVILSESIDIEGSDSNSQRDKYPSYFYTGDDKQYFAMDEFEKLYEGQIMNFTDVKPGQFTTKNSLRQMAPYSVRARILIKVGKLATRIITGAPLDDPESRMMFEGIVDGNIDSVCNQSGGIISKRMIDKVVRSANSYKGSDI